MEGLRAARGNSRASLRIFINQEPINQRVNYRTRMHRDARGPFRRGMWPPWGESCYKVVVGKRLIGQITLIKGNNASRFHGRITMQASQVHLNISLMPARWAGAVRRTCARFFIRINAHRYVRRLSSGRVGPRNYFETQSVSRGKRPACRH